MPRILRLSLRSFCSSSVSNEPSSTSEPGHRQHVEGDRRDVLHRLREGRRRAPSWVSSAALSTTACDLPVELLDAGQPAARDRLVGRDDHARRARPRACSGCEHRHRGHGRAVGVGDDALAHRRASALRVDLADDQRHVGVHPPGRAVVDDDRRRPRRTAAPARATSSAPAENSAMSSPVGSAVAASSTVIVAARHRAACVPAERAEAKKRSSTRSGSRARRAAGASRAPTWPVAPTTPTRSRRACSSPGPAVDDRLGSSRAELERVVHRADGDVELGVAADDRDADLRGADRLDVDAGVGERLEERSRRRRGASACRRRPARPCRCARRSCTSVEADAAPAPRSSAAMRGRAVGLGQREGDVGAACWRRRDVLHDHVDVDLGVGERRGRCCAASPGRSGTPTTVILRLASGRARRR